MDFNCEECDLTNYKEKCILHCEKDTWYTLKDGIQNWSQSKNSIQEFWEQVRSIINFIKKSPNLFVEEKEIVFDNYIFPKFETNYAFSKQQARDSFFHKEKRIFDLKIIFKNCTFLDHAIFNNITFKKGLTFDNCNFENSLNMRNMIFNQKSKVRIQNCPKVVNANFENTTFNDLADFYNSTFEGKETKFEKTNFEDIVVFSESTFKENIDFRYTKFNRLAQFKETIFEEKLNLEDSIIKEEINFIKVKNKNKNDLTSDNLENRETARIIKHSFEKQDNIIEANKFYAIEMKKREEELNDKNSSEYNFWDRLVFKIHGIASNHSQDWTLPLFWIIIFGFLSGTVDFYSLKISTEQKEIYPHISLICLLGLVVFLPIFYWIYNQVRYFKKLVLPVLFIFLTYSAYAVLTHDYYLNIFYTKTINPFSIMQSNDDINIIQLLFKMIFAYLIYQFIVSIRQNTRRK